jgi:glutathione S-transferase
MQAASALKNSGSQSQDAVDDTSRIWACLLDISSHPPGVGRAVLCACHDVHMPTLHYYPSNASFAPHVLLHEIGAPFELKLVDRTRGAHRSPEYLALNPNGLIPVLQDGDLVLYETAAICLHLADTNPAAGLAPPLGTPARAEFYKWLVWLTNTLQAHLIHYFYPDRMVDQGNTLGAAQVKAHAQAKVAACLLQIDAQLAKCGGPWLLGADYSAADIYAFMLCRWTRGFDTGPARSLAHIAPWLQRVLERPAVQRAVATEQLPQPIY